MNFARFARGLNQKGWALANVASRRCMDPFDNWHKALNPCLIKPVHIDRGASGSAKGLFREVRKFKSATKFYSYQIGIS